MSLLVPQVSKLRSLREHVISLFLMEMWCMCRMYVCGMCILQQHGYVPFGDICSVHAHATTYKDHRLMCPHCDQDKEARRVVPRALHVNGTATPMAGRAAQQANPVFPMNVMQLHTRCTYLATTPSPPSS